MQSVTVATFRDDPLFPKISRAVEMILAKDKVVRPVDVLVGMHLLSRDDLDAWRFGRVPYLEKVIDCNLTRLSRLLRILRFHVHDLNRVIAFHRWLEGTGQDVVVVATLSETTWYNYDVGFPGPGAWAEVFNSDVYDNWVNPIVAGNGGGISASGPPMHGF